MSRQLWCAAAAAVCWALPLAGQVADAELVARHRNECRFAEQVLSTGHPSPHRDRALAYISQCETEGAVVLASLWKTTPVGTDILHLFRSSVQLRDARLYQQLRATAADRSRPAEVRAAAMLVLARNTDPRNAIGLRDLVPPDSVDWIPLKPGWGTGVRQTTGDVPLTEPIASSVLALFEQIAAARDTEPVQVWYAAAVLAERLRRDIQAGFAH